MLARMDLETLIGQLEAGQIVPLRQAEWDELRAAFDLIEEHDTRMSGLIELVRSSAGIAAVEQPAPDQRVVRPLADLEAAHSFIADRLDTYDRMWDGCGCKIDYFG